MLKRARISGSSYLVDKDNKTVAKSFTRWCEEWSFEKKVAQHKREYILNFMARDEADKFFIKLDNNEIYLTNEGELFMESCKHTTSIIKKYVRSPKKESSSVENLATEDDDKKILIEQTNAYIKMFVEMGSQTHNPFSINRCYPNTISSPKRVFFDLYRNINGIHEGYIILSGNGSMFALQKHVLTTGRYAVLKKEYGDNMRIVIVAPNFEHDAKNVMESSINNLICVTIGEMMVKLKKEAMIYYAEGDAEYKLKNWDDLYTTATTN